MPEPRDVESTPAATADTGAPRVVTVELTVRIKALALEEPTGGYSVVVPALPGCVTEGDDIEEARAHVVEAAEGWLESQHDARRAEALRDMLP